MGKHTKDTTKDAGKPVIKDKTKLPTVNGWGERTSLSWDKYVEKGKFKAGKLDGPGERTLTTRAHRGWRESVQEGRFENGIFVEGTEKLKNGIMLEGTFQKHPIANHNESIYLKYSEFISGTKTAPDGTVSKGTFTPRAAYCVLHGDDCVETTPDGVVRKGTFDHGDFTAGTETHPNGEIREGTFRFGHGKGKITYGKDHDRNSKTGLLWGTGLIRDDDPLRSCFSGPALWAEGSWDPEGKLNGPGKMMHRNDYAVHEGIFANDRLVQGKKIEPEGFGEGTFDDKGNLHGQGKRVFCIRYGDVYCKHGPEAAAAHLAKCGSYKEGQGIFCHGELHGFTDGGEAGGKYGVVTHGEPCSYSEGMQGLLNLQDEESEESEEE
jgi:hypothetical protein